MSRTLDLYAIERRAGHLALILGLAAVRAYMIARHHPRVTRRIGGAK